MLEWLAGARRLGCGLLLALPIPGLGEFGALLAYCTVTAFRLPFLQLSSLRFSWNPIWTTFRTSRSEGLLHCLTRFALIRLVVFSLE